MTLKHGVQEITTTAGTGTVTLYAVSNYSRVSDRFSVGDLIDYLITAENEDKEWGVGTVGAGNTMARTTITGTIIGSVYTSGGTALTLSGRSTVSCVQHEGSNAAIWSLDANNNPTGQRGPDGQFVRTIGGPRKAALLGDSIIAQNLEVSSGNTYYRGKGFLTWAQARLGHPWDIQAADNYAVGGTSTTVMISSQLPLLKAGHLLYNYDRCFISSGTNDSQAGDSLATIIENTTRLIGDIGGLGIIPVHIGVLPRATSGGMTDRNRKNLRLNDWLANYAARTGNLEFIQGACESVANNADANGYILAAASADALHPNDWGAYYIGEALYNYYAGMGLPSALQFAQSQADQFEATYNASGVLFDSPNPLLLGTAGSAPLEYPTGMSAAGTNCTWTKATRNLSNGQTRATSVCTIAGATSNGYLYDDNVASGAWDTEEIDEGDTIYAQAIVEVTTGAAGVQPYLTMVESDGVTTKTVSCLVRDVVDCPAIPNGTLLTLRTPNHVVRAYGGSGNCSVFSKLNVYSGGNTGVITVRAFEMRKVV